MDNSEATLQCQNLTCLASNPATNKFCQKCGIPLVRRYLRVLGDWSKTYYHLGDLLDDRYLFKGPQIVLDTKPALSPQTSEEFPGHIIPYLKLFSYRLHIPQIYGYIPTPDERIDMTIWLLEYGTVPTDPTGELIYPQLLPEFAQLWPEVSALRQLNWLWQMAKLWQPLRSKGVASSLLNPALLRINDRTIQLLELQQDTDDVTVNLKQLGQLWHQWVSNASPIIQDFLEQLCQKLIERLITRSEQLLSILDQALLQIGQSQKRTYQIFTYSDTGPTREHNEDSCYPITNEVITVDEQQIPLGIVCDGIGGQEGGEIASSLAISTLFKEVSSFYRALSSWNPNGYTNSLEKAIAIANDEISQRNDEENRHERQRMGTTLVLGLAYFHEMYIAHVGDSRVYWITPTSCHQLTTDDDLASREVRLGYLAYRDAIQYPNAGALVQALGMSGSKTLHPTIQRLVLDESCVFLLCSDGLSDYDRVEQFWETEIVPILSENKDVAEVGRELIKIANEKNGHDNVTIALIYCQVQQNEENSQTPLSFSNLESSVFSLSDSTFIEGVEEINIKENDSNDIPTAISAPAATSIPTSSSTPAPASTHSRSFSRLPILLGLLSVGILVVAGGYLGYKFIFQNQPLSGEQVPNPSESPNNFPTISPEKVSLFEGELIQIIAPTEFKIIAQDPSQTPAEKIIQIPGGSIFEVSKIKENAVLLKNCSPQRGEGSQRNTTEDWILKSSLNSQNYKSINHSSEQVQVSENCQSGK